MGIDNLPDSEKDVIDVLATEPDQDRLTEEDWNWAIK